MPVDAIGRRCPIGVFTGASLLSARILLGGAGLAGLFGVLVGGDEVERPKPAPDGVLDRGVEEARKDNLGEQRQADGPQEPERCPVRLVEGCILLHPARGRLEPLRPRGEEDDVADMREQPLRSDLVPGLSRSSEASAARAGRRVERAS